MKDRKHWSTREHLTPATQMAVSSADIVIVPMEGFRGNETPAFAEGTRHLLPALEKAAASSGLSVAVAGEDTDYKEIGLHSALIELGVFLVTQAALPVLLGFLTNWAYDRWLRRGKPEDPANTEVRFRIVREFRSNDGRSSTTFDISGPVDAVKAARISADGLTIELGNGVKIESRAKAQ